MGSPGSGVSHASGKGRGGQGVGHSPGDGVPYPGMWRVGMDNGLGVRGWAWSQKRESWGLKRKVLL